MQDLSESVRRVLQHGSKATELEKREAMRAYAGTTHRTLTAFPPAGGPRGSSGTPGPGSTAAFGMPKMPPPPPRAGTPPASSGGQATAAGPPEAELTREARVSARAEQATAREVALSRTDNEEFETDLSYLEERYVGTKATPS